VITLLSLQEKHLPAQNLASSMPAK